MASNNKETFPGFRIEDGFLIGNRWSGGATVMVGVHAIERIELGCGNSPPADRIYFLNARATPIDIKRTFADADKETAANEYANLENA